jgi:dTMP kinase
MQFIVLEGLDGAGKSTQVNRIRNYYENLHIQTQFIHFPRTENPYFGDMAARFLRGEFGNLNEVNPYLVAMIYAGDRKDAAFTIQQWLNSNQVVIADRYVYSNIAYQCAKFSLDEDKIRLKDWILDFEFNYYQLPKPTLNLFLDVPFDFTKNSLSKNRLGSEREYLQGKNDIHEQNLQFQETVKLEYLNLCKNDECFKRIDCSNKHSQILSEEEIFQKIKCLL